jgi:hypothetical protein
MDVNTSNLLSRIYEADAPQMGQQTLELWKVLALDYVNNPMWQPRRNINDERLLDIGKKRYILYLIVFISCFNPYSLYFIFFRSLSCTR